MRPLVVSSLLLFLALAPGCGLWRRREKTTEEFVSQAELYAGLRIQSAAYEVCPGTDRITVRARLTLVNEGHRPLTSFRFYISNAAHDVGVTAGAERLDLTRWRNPRFQRVFEVTLNGELAVDQTTNMDVDYTYRPDPEEMGGDRRITPDDTYVCDYLWVPRIQPGEDRPFDSFPYSMEITVAPGMEGIADGLLTGIEKDGDQLRYSYRCSERAMPFFAAGRYQRIEDTHGSTRITAFVLERWGLRGAEWARRYLEFIKRTMDVYVAAFGPIALPYYRLINIGSGRANFGIRAGMLLADRNFAGVAPGATTLWIIAHELAHSWWGDSIQSYGSGSGLLTEAMANYAAALAFGSVFGDDTEKDLLRSYRTVYERTSGDRLALADQDGFLPLYYTSTYNRGALTIHMLEQLIGRDDFQKILRSFVAAHRGTSVPLATFLDHMAAQSPTDIDPFIRNFIESTRLPDYAISSVESADSKGGSVVRVVNEGKATFPVTLRVAGPQGQIVDRSITVTPHSSTEIELPMAVQWAEIDPEQTLLERDTGNNFWPKGPFHITGRVGVGDKGAVPEAVVKLWAPGDLPGRVDLVSDDLTDRAGQFELTRLAPGPYILTAAAPNAVPLAREVELRGDLQVDLTLAPLLDASLLRFDAGTVRLEPLRRVDGRWLAPWSGDEEALVVLNEGRSDEMVVRLPPVRTNQALLRISVRPDDSSERVPCWIVVEPSAAAEMTLAAHAGRSSLRRSLLKKGWYRQLLAP